MEKRRTGDATSRRERERGGEESPKFLLDFQFSLIFPGDKGVAEKFLRRTEIHARPLAVTALIDGIAMLKWRILTRRYVMCKNTNYRYANRKLRNKNSQPFVSTASTIMILSILLLVLF